MFNKAQHLRMQLLNNNDRLWSIFEELRKRKQHHDWTADDGTLTRIAFEPDKN